MIDYNIASNNLPIDYITPINNRAKLDTGTQCNYKCSFCYYFDKLDQVTPFHIIKDRIDYIVDCGFTEIDLSGGESSIHSNWFDILDYCSEKNLYISTLSNGSKFSDIDFLKKSKEHGLSEILFSLHGYEESLHNSLVSHPKAFSKILTAIENSNTLGIKVRINCTVQKKNYLELSTKFVDLIKPFDIFEVNFLTLNYWDAANSIDIIDYNQITPEIKKAIDKLKHSCLINVRYTPYCFMKGYEKYVCNYYQHIYDIFDWNIAVYNKSEDTLPSDFYKNNKLKLLFESAKENRLHTYTKTKDCFDCKFFFICDGFEKNMPNLLIHPSPGVKITDVNFFRKDFFL
jgi:MoaA/NifB/PqqE/SkfB family radical SAM enzyme